MQRYLTEMRRAPDVHVLWDAFIGFFAARGIGQLYAVQDPPPGAAEAGPPIMGSHGLPEFWAQRYVRPGARGNDPVSRLCRRHPTPFYWHDVIGLADLSVEETDFCKAFEALDLAGCVFIPVFGPHGRNGYLALFTGAVSPLAEHDLRTYQTIAQMSHQRYCELADAARPESVGLSPREAEILQWVARGKSNSAIAHILEISPSTVDTYLRRIFRKLGATDRTVASIRGIGLGLISP